MRRSGTSAGARARRVMACLMVFVLVAGLVPVLPKSPFALAEEADATLADGPAEDGGEGIVLGDEPAEGDSGESGSADASGEEGDGSAVELGEDDGKDAGADSGADGEVPSVESGEGTSAETGGEVAATTDDGEPEDGPDVEAQSTGVSVSNPRVVADSSMNAGQVTTWDCVWFGSYPQTEVTPSDAAYASIQSASWDASGNATVGGTRYRRISRTDTTYDYYFGSATYRYFRYDPIKWRVLKVTGTTALVVADVALDDQRYNANYADVTWETSGIRSWLNGYGAASNQPGTDFSGKSFVDAAFSSAERQAILQSSVANANNACYGTAGGNDTRDEVFLLSEAEVYGSGGASHGFAASYDTYDEARCCKATDFAHAMGAWVHDGGDQCDGNCWWWLRSPGCYAHCAANVYLDGCVYRDGYYVHDDSVAVRPALNLNLKSANLQAAGTVSSNGAVDEHAPTGAGGGGSADYVSISNTANIVDKVRAYTSGDLKSQYFAIMEADLGDEAKFRLLNEFFVGKGFLNPRDGMDYIKSTLAQRRAYDGLVCDDVFIAHQYYWWLNETVTGRAARVCLVADDYIFNAKYSGYINLPALAKGETPNVKKCKDLLYDFMDGIGLEEVKAGYAEFIEDAGKTADKLDEAAGKVTDAGETYANQLIRQLDDAKTNKEAQAILKKAKDLGIEAKKGKENGKITYSMIDTSGFGKFLKAMGKASKVLSFILDTWDDVEDLVTLDAHLRCYTSYSMFLREVIQATDLPLQMRWAAAQILAEMDSGPWYKIRDIAFRLVDTALDVGGEIGTASITSELFDSARKAALGEGAAATVAGYVAAVQISAWGINMITDVGSLSKGSDIIEGYERLCSHYRDKLVASKDAFVASESEENAWDFFENYNLLWQLRVKGEKAYFKMMDIGGVTKYLVQNGTQLKREAVNESLARLGEMAFVLDDTTGVPDSAQFAKYSSKVKLVVDCPVDVDVYDSSGKFVCTMRDGRESEVTNSHGTFVVTYRPWTGEWAKAAFVGSGGYRLVARAKDAGSVSVKMMTGDDKENVWATDNVAVRKGSKVELDVRDDATGATTRVDANGDGKYESRKECREVGSSPVRVTGVTLGSKSLKLVVGESATLVATVSPANAACQNVRWVSANEKVATVQGGKVVAVGKGSTSVMCVSEDNSDVMATCMVSVAPKVYKGKTYSKSGMKYKVTKVATAKKAGAVTLVRAKNAAKVTVPVSVKLADGRTYYVTAIGKGAFKSLSKVATVVVGSKVSTVSSGAISNLPRLTSVTLGTGVKKVASGAVVKVPKLATITVKGKLLKSKASVKGMLKGSKLKKTVTVRVPKSMLKTYKKVFTKTNLSSPQKVVVK